MTAPLDANKADVYEKAMRRVQLARELRKELLLICPDSQADAAGARGNAAARCALNTAIDIIVHSRPVKMPNAALDGHWAGMLDAACRIISAVEMEMYDPRVHPERYK